MKKDSRRGVIAAGTWILDMGKRIDHWPEPETLALIEEVVPTNGGAAFNVACDLARLDPSLPVRGIGLIGADGPGDTILEMCASLGIDTSGLERLTEAPTSFTDVMTERGSGRRTFFHAPGANVHLDESRVCIDAEDSGIFFLGYLGLLPGLDEPGPDGVNGSARLFQKASAAGLMTAADLVSAPNDRLAVQVVPCLPHLDILFANEWEASRLLGAPLEPGTEISFLRAAEMARGIRALGLRGQAVVHFAGGAVCAEPDGSCHGLGAVRVPPEEIVGTTGAGDAFASGFLVGTLHGGDSALELAVCAAAVSLGSLTCSDAIAPADTCLARGRERGFSTPMHSL